MIEDIEDAITLSMQEASMMAEIEANERRLKWAREMIENQEVREEASKRSRELVMREAENDDDDDYDDYYDDECSPVDECYPDDE